MSNSIKLNGNGELFEIADLGGMEKGSNAFECYLKGTAGAVMTINFDGIGDVVFTLAGTGWNKYELADSSGITSISIPTDTNFITITATASNNAGNDISISGMRLYGS
jgi:hypothetical protein